MPLTVGGWTLLFHDMMIGQLTSLGEAYARARKANPEDFRSNTNVRVLAAIAKLVLRVIPGDPGRTDYRLGNSMGPDYRHWSRAKFGGRFRLFFRYDSVAKIIIFAWVNDETTLRSRGGRNDPYAVFKSMLDRGSPPDSWSALRIEAGDLPEELLTTIAEIS